MSRAAELMAKLAPRGIAFDIVSFGGRPELTPQDIAAAMGMAHLDSLTEWLLRVRYVGDGGCWNDLRHGWYLRVHDIGRESNWPRPSSERPTWMVMAYTSLIEHVHHRRCHVCKGAKEITINAKVIQCQTCRASGLRAVSERKLAKLANVSRSEWANQYAALLNICRGELQTIEDRGVARVAARLRRAEVA